MTTSVKHITNTMRGAPVLSGLAGSLIPVLDALFISGWGAVTALSVSVSGGVATATFSSGQSFDRDAVILVAGATPGALNGEARVLTSGNTYCTWATGAADGPATGTIAIKYAPQSDWKKVYGATNQAVYRSDNVQGTGAYFKIDDTVATYARITGYESMSAIDTGTGQFPTTAQLSGGGYLHRSSSSSATAVRYRIACDELFVLLCITGNTASAGIGYGASSRGFGDPIALSPSGDPWGAIISAMGTTSNGNTATGSLDTQSTSGLTSGFVVSPRSISGLGSCVVLNPAAYSGSGTSGYNDTFGNVPSAVDGRVRVSKMYVRESTTYSPPRADVPGMLFLPHYGVLSSFADGDTMLGSGALEGRRLLVVPTWSNYSSVAFGAYLVDLTGPWR